MKSVCRKIDTIHPGNAFFKILIILVSCIFCMIVALYSNLYLKEDTVYTHFFYIPIILTGIWYGREALYMALSMGVFHIIINYSACGVITISSLQRGVVFIVIALMVYLLANVVKNAHKIVNTVHEYSSLYKRLIILISCTLCMAAAFYVNLYLKEDIVYTHFFYIPIILTSIWYGIKSFYLAVFLGIFHISINYIVFGTLTPSSLHRALFFVVIALTVYILTDFRYGQLRQNPNRAEAGSQGDNQPSDPRLQQINLAGQLGVAVGHEIRNPLTTVRGFLQMLDDERDYEGVQEYFSLMIEEIDRADAAIAHIIDLAENKNSNLEKQNLNNILNECLSDYLPPVSMGKINIETSLRKIPDLLLDKIEIQKLLVNMLNNAAEAMPSGGAIIIGSDIVANEVILTIHDQGPGIPAEIAKQIGTPFFTTKESSSGLGLAICYSIARRHSAGIEFVSTSKGTKFYVRFPLSTPEIQTPGPLHDLCACTTTSG